MCPRPRPRLHPPRAAGRAQMTKKTIFGRTSTLTPVHKATSELVQLFFHLPLTRTIMEAWLHAQGARADITCARGRGLNLSITHGGRGVGHRRGDLRGQADAHWVPHGLWQGDALRQRRFSPT